MAQQVGNEKIDSALVAEFEALARRAGIEILEDRRQPMLDTFCDYRRMTALLHGERPAVAEGANVFRLDTIARGR